MADPVRVAQVLENLEIGGLEKIVWELCRHLDADRFRPVVVCLGAGGALVEPMRDGGISVHAFGKGPGFQPRVVARLRRIVGEEKVRILHCHNSGPLVYGALVRALDPRVRLVYTVHGVTTSGDRKQRLFQRVGLVDRLVTVSEDARRVAIEKAGVPADRVSTVINGIDLEAYAPRARDEATRAELGADVGTFVVGIVARLSKEKDHANLLRAFAQAFEDDGATARRTARLVVVGDGPLRGELQRLAEEAGIAASVSFLGSRHDVARLLGAFDCFVLSSYTEGLAVTLLEAAASGLPIVATAVGGNVEVVEDGVTGILVPPRDGARLAEALSRLAANREEARAMGLRGRERVRARFGIEGMVERYQSIYTELLS